MLVTSYSGFGFSDKPQMGYGFNYTREGCKSQKALSIFSEIDVMFRVLYVKFFLNNMNGPHDILWFLCRLYKCAGLFGWITWAGENQHCMPGKNRKRKLPKVFKEYACLFSKLPI